MYYIFIDDDNEHDDDHNDDNDDDVQFISIHIVIYSSNVIRYKYTDVIYVFSCHSKTLQLHIIFLIYFIIILTNSNYNIYLYRHPDAHACRLKISLVTIDSGMKFPWDLTIECSRYAVKLDSVSSYCRLALEEELQLLETDFIVTNNSVKNYNKNIHTEYAMSLCYNRQQVLRCELQQVHKSSSSSSSSTTSTTSLIGSSVNSIQQQDHLISIRAPARALSTNWPYYQDNTIFGENYQQMREVYSIDEGDHNWRSEVPI